MVRPAFVHDLRCCKCCMDVTRSQSQTLRTSDAPCFFAFISTKQSRCNGMFVLHDKQHTVGMIFFASWSAGVGDQDGRLLSLGDDWLQKRRESNKI